MKNYCHWIVWLPVWAELRGLIRHRVGSGKTHSKDQGKPCFLASENERKNPRGQRERPRGTRMHRPCKMWKCTWNDYRDNGDSFGSNLWACHIYHRYLLWTKCHKQRYVIGRGTQQEIKTVHVGAWSVKYPSLLMILDLKACSNTSVWSQVHTDYSDIKNDITAAFVTRCLTGREGPLPPARKGKQYVCLQNK